MSLTHLLCIDVGNSRTNLGLFEGETLLRHDFYPSSVEYAPKVVETATAWKAELGIDASIMGAVVPRLADLIVTCLDSEADVRPFLVEGFKEQLLPLRVDRPETVGVDRVINSYGAYHLYGGPAIVVSLGTATTFEILSAQGEYLGGCIAPGVRISMEALTQRTALLPPAVWKRPQRIIGKNTLEHMEAGIYYGTVSLIEGMTSRYKAELGTQARVIGTGGISAIIADEGVFDVHDLELTLKGLRRIYSDRFENAI